MWRLALKVLFLGTFLLVGLIIFPSKAKVRADCWPTRVINQWACIAGTGCQTWKGGGKGEIKWCASAPQDTECTSNSDICNAGGAYGTYTGPCIPICESFTPGNTCNQTSSVYVSCTPAPDCSWSGSLTTCSQQTQSGSCSTGTENKRYGCWGPCIDPPCPGGGNGGGCGNGLCDIDEDCASCATDCGACPTPTPPPPPPSGNVQARAAVVSRSDTSCTAIAASANYLSGTVFSLSPAVTPATKTQNLSGNYEVWNNIDLSTYTLSATPPTGNYSLANGCYTKTGGAPYTQGLAAALGGGETITWNVGFTLPGPWVQTQGADVYAAVTLTSLLPTGISPRAFNLDGTGNSPGVVTYGSTGINPYDFDISTTSQGETLVSSKNWLVNESYATRDFYPLFYTKFGAPTTPDYTNPAPLTKPASRSTPYYVQGDLTTSGNWSIADSENLVFLVDGNLTINGRINLTGSGVIVFVVRGNITVSPTVGVAASSTTPVVEGIYLTSGTFTTGQSTNPGTEKFVGQGMFIANTFILERDLGDTNNTSYPAELFSYNPQLLLTMPQAMKDTPITWEEVAP